MNNEKNINTAEENTKEDTIPIIYLTFYNQTGTLVEFYISKDGKLLDGYMGAPPYLSTELSFSDLGYGTYTFIFFNGVEKKVSYDYKLTTQNLTLTMTKDKQVLFEEK